VIGSGADSTPSLGTVAIVLAVLVIVAFLTYFDKVSGDAAVGLFGGLVGVYANRAGVAQGAKASEVASTSPPPEG
jgi:hypothetical protein